MVVVVVVEGEAVVEVDEVVDSDVGVAVEAEGSRVIRSVSLCVCVCVCSVCLSVCLSDATVLSVRLFIFRFVLLCLVLGFSFVLFCYFFSSVCNALLHLSVWCLWS